MFILVINKEKSIFPLNVSNTVRNRMFVLFYLITMIKDDRIEFCYEKEDQISDFFFFLKQQGRDGAWVYVGFEKRSGISEVRVMFHLCVKPGFFQSQ